MKNFKYISLLLTSFLFTGCFNNSPQIKKTDSEKQINMYQEQKYITKEMNNMIKMVYENNFIQQKISDAIDDLGTSTINNYNNQIFKTEKIPYDNIDRITNQFIKIYNINRYITLYKLSLIDYNNNMIKLTIRKDLPLLYYYIISKNIGIGKLANQYQIEKYLKNNNYAIYRITNKSQLGKLYIEKYNKDSGLFDNKLEINLNKIKDYVNNMDNIIITIKKIKEK